ncbi:hypothetical protein A3K63_05475 [Candidatus Micrarchaeota archaeon RBG_16_49_10]|nr:MAG: hypothetical protein A3K63_05475 [Candidatus Micrarchaeota archaeon RBG_16_49_10]
MPVDIYSPDGIMPINWIKLDVENYQGTLTLPYTQEAFENRYRSMVDGIQRKFGDNPQIAFIQTGSRFWDPDPEKNIAIATIQFDVYFKRERPDGKERKLNEVFLD